MDIQINIKSMIRKYKIFVETINNTWKLEKIYRFFFVFGFEHVLATEKQEMF